MGSRKEEASPTLKNGGGITTLDLIYWSLQIASGMNHLANKKVSQLFLFYISSHRKILSFTNKSFKLRLSKINEGDSR